MNDNRLSILISTHAGGRWGGITTLYTDLLSSRLKELVRLSYVDDHARSGGFARAGQARADNMISALYYYVRLVAALLRARPQVAHIATAPGLSFVKHGLAVWLVRLLGVPVVLAPHFSYTLLFSGGRTRQWFARHVLGSCQGLLALSTEWLALRESLPECLIEYMPNAIDLAPYSRIPRPRPGAGASPVTILFLGHIGRDKGSFDLVEAAGRLRCEVPGMAFRIEMRGESLHPGEMEEVQKLIEERALRDYIAVRPPVFLADKVACLAQADVFALPSYHEGMPISLIEAMAAGLPIVATSVGGIPDMVTSGENGLLAPPGSPAELARALATMICDGEQRTWMGLRGRQRALECHNLDRRIPEFVSFHARVAGTGL